MMTSRRGEVMSLREYAMVCRSRRLHAEARVSTRLFCFHPYLRTETMKNSTARDFVFKKWDAEFARWHVGDQSGVLQQGEDVASVTTIFCRQALSSRPIKLDHVIFECIVAFYEKPRQVS